MSLINNTHSHYGAKNKQQLEKIKNSFEKWIQDHLNSNEVYFVMSEDENKDIISMGIGIIDTRAPIVGALNGKSGWISSLIVHPKYRGQGLGKETLNHLINWFTSNNISKVVLHSTPEGETLYKSSGFTKDSENIFIKNI
ncbi:GNAT family N-acetyltransferase [Staphylococcus epidermidis]|nr:GNAT family N-acetyltransferase [Staphylococcus epidermidis]